ncbi:MAG TPA: SDR family oxidoreductase [Burkholderiales bacterium]|nr:SDR family oxidoreductase [Burkholderiales bacterium]
MKGSTLLLAAGAGLAAALAARAALRHSRRFSFGGRTVLISGGSRGMGLVLARQLVDAGARVALLARTASDLEQAASELRERGGEVFVVPCDVGRLDEVHSAVQQTLAHFGHIDVLFNVAGIIQVGPLEAMTRDDFRRAMDVHFWGPLNTTLEVLPQMRRRGWGRIVNVASLGGKRAVPHMLPYTASKFALVGLSNGLRTELAKDGILVTTVCPSLVRTGSPRNALFKGQYRKEYAWFSVADSLPGLAMSAERAAAQILRACRDGEREVVLRNPANLAVPLQSMLPGTTQALLGALARLLPRMGGIGQFSAYGYESASRWSPSWLTRLSDTAARRNNEMRARPE